MKIAELLQADGANIQISVSANDLREFAESIVKQTIEKTQVEQREKLIPRKMLKQRIPDSTLVAWKNKGFLVPVYVGAKAFYKQSDLEAINIHFDNETQQN